MFDFVAGVAGEVRNTFKAEEHQGKGKRISREGLGRHRCYHGRNMEYFTGKEGVSGG